jgi:uncharacterized RDD family membrane protein YckC
VLATAPLLARDGRTMGQRLAGIRLVREDGGEAGLVRALTRQFTLPGLALAALLAHSPAGLGLSLAVTAADGAASLVDAERRTLRDRALDTRVVRS